jgi:hypothetical protein
VNAEQRLRRDDGDVWLVVGLVAAAVLALCAAEAL